jgi:hypothetical protein
MWTTLSHEVAIGTGGSVVVDVVVDVAVVVVVVVVEVVVVVSGGVAVLIGAAEVITGAAVVASAGGSVADELICSLQATSATSATSAVTTRRAPPVMAWPPVNGRRSGGRSRPRHGRSTRRGGR